MSIYRGAGGAGDAVADSSSEASLIRELTEQTQVVADEAAVSATNAANSANAASTSESNAATSATNAANSATAASSSATSASNSASAASTSATNAANSATAAQTAETNAETAETNAETAETNAETAATNAASSASAASTSATNASNSASAASTSATNASNSATAAATSETNAASSATSASGSASTATTQASNAATSATNAATSETNAASSASTATTQAGVATTKAGEASTSATNASNSASAASTSETNAATSATSAASAQSAAETARDQTLAAFDSFDDRYLGQKSTAPTLDNDGNALVAGALYFNTSSNEMRVWDGTQWLNAYASLSGALLATNNLSDLNNTATARTNLGLGTAATTAATDYATAAQGALADSALQSFTETDPVFSSSEAASITSTDTANWDTAYSWGDHSSAGYYAASNPSGYISSINGTDVTTALGYTPYNSTNPAGYTTNTGTVTSVSGTGTASGLSLSGTVTTSGNLTLSGTVNSLAAGTYGISISGSSASCTGNAATATYATTAGRAYPLRVGGVDLNFNWSGQSGQPPWLWGGSDGSNMYVYDPSNFSVSYANSAGSASTATTATNASYATNANSVSGVQATMGTTGSGLNTDYAGQAGPQVYGNGGSGAVWSLHRPGAYGLNIGLDSDNVFRIGGWSAAANRLQMDMSGNLTMAGNITAYSDERLKKNWRPVQDNFISKLAQVKSGIYERTDQDATQAGVSAQSLQTLLPEAVNEDADGMLNVAYGNAAMVACVELAKVIEQLRLEIAELKAK